MNTCILENITLLYAEILFVIFDGFFKQYIIHFLCMVLLIKKIQNVILLKFISTQSFLLCRDFLQFTLFKFTLKEEHNLDFLCNTKFLLKFYSFFIL